MRIHLLALGLVVGGYATPALAATDTACWNRDIERLDFFLDPPEKGDNTFFTAVSNSDQNTNVVLLYSATTTMKEFPQKLYRIRVDLGGTTPTGCTNTYLNNRTYFMPTDVTAPAGSSALQGVYSASKTYPDPGPTYSGGSGQSDGLSNTSYYQYGNWGVNGSGIVSQTLAAACVASGGGSQQAACQACVNSKGYWLNPLAANNDRSTSAGVFSGNFLRFYPPKWTMLSLAYKRMVNGPLLAVLREGVEAQNGTNGGQIVQKMLPQSCSGTGRPMTQKLGAIDSLSYTSGANPLAEMLFNAAWFMAGQPTGSPWPFTNSATQGGSAMSSGKSGPCNTCGGDFIVVFSDGRGDTANPACTQVAGVTPASCTAAAQCSTLGMGAENDGNDFLDPSLSGGTGTTITGSTVRQTPGGTCDMDFADDVARWMASNAAYQTAAGTRVRTFVVGIGDPDNTYGEMTILEKIALEGEGDYVPADNFRDLENGINVVMTNIINRTTSFSAAAVTTVQSSGYTSALIPRFKPSGNTQWNGTLMRFQLFNEFANGCSSTDFNIKNTNNPNGNNSCYDVYLADKNNAFIGEDSTGSFVQLDTSATYDAGWPIKTTADGGTYPAVPIWEASNVLATRENAVIAGDSSQARKIYTVAPNGSTGSYTPTLVPFTVANVAAITPLLKLGGVTGDFCTTLGFQTRHTYSTEDDCAADVIKFIHGEDILLQNSYNRTIPAPTVKKSRPNLLGDIMHSTPVLVSAPVQSYLCDLGIANQCVPSLYLSTLTSGGSTSYQSYSTTYQYRSQFVLVAANDGMIHAFNAGNDTVSGGVHSFDFGTGAELWAFIPPDVLPKLMRYVTGERHELLADGTPMVRDIWADGSGSVSTPDRQKQADEYHTVAIVGEREGGRHVLGLDVTDPATPKFLWLWPPPGTVDDLAAGESWNDLGPAAPPIGPIAEYDATGTFTIHGDRAKERYVVALNGGYDPALLRGRGIYFVDAWTGSTVYRYAAIDSTGSTDPRSKLGSVAAPVSMIDTDSDGLFDTAVVGDTAGQVWTVSMYKPGQAGANGLYNNWFGGRAFTQFKASPFWHRSPFFQRATTALLPTGEIRVMLGSGDRDQIKDPNGGTCGLANLSACLRKNCSVTVNSTRYRLGAAPSGAAGGHYVQGQYAFTSGGTEPTQTLSTDALGQSAACTDAVDGRIDYTLVCGATTNTYQSSAYCDWGTPDCPVDSGRPIGTKLNYTPSITMENSRFYSFKLFDTSNRAQFSTSAAALTYDTNALTDTNLVNAATTTASSSGDGWYIAQNHSIDEKTSSGALLIAGCTLWNTLVPTTATVATCGGTANLPLDTAYAYQADATTGAVACGQAGSSTYTATARSTARSTYVAPQQPSLVLSVNSRGQVAYGAVSIEPGVAPSSTNTATGEITGGTVHWLDVSRKLHDCRHSGINCN